MQVIDSNMSFDNNATIHFYAQKTIGEILTEVAIFQMPNDSMFYLARCDDGEFLEDESYHTLHQAFAAVLRCHIVMPL